MPKKISSAVSAQLSAQQRRPANLFILGLGSGVTLRYAAAKTNVTFPAAGDTYIAKAASYGKINTTTEGQVGRVSVRLDNTARDLAAYANQIGFKGRKLLIWRIFRDASGTTDYDTIFSGYMEEPNYDYNWMLITATSGLALDKKYPEKNYGRMCSLKFGGTRCNADGNSNLTSNSLATSSFTVRGGVTHFYDTMLKSSAASTWIHARIRLFVGGVTEERLGIDFKVSAGGGTVIFDVPCKTAISASTRYEMIRGCSKNWTACSGVSAFGPTADNRLNYGGFLHVGKNPDSTNAV